MCTAERRQRLIALLAPLVARHLPRSRAQTEPDVRAALTGSALACLDVAQLAWAEHPGASLGRLLDDAMAALRARRENA